MFLIGDWFDIESSGIAWTNDDPPLRFKSITRSYMSPGFNVLTHWPLGDAAVILNQ